MFYKEEYCGFHIRVERNATVRERFRRKKMYLYDISENGRIIRASSHAEKRKVTYPKRTFTRAKIVVDRIIIGRKKALRDMVNQIEEERRVKRTV